MKEENIDYRKEVKILREKITDNSFQPESKSEEEIELLSELVCGMILMVEDNLREDQEWENASLAREYLMYATVLEGFDHKLDLLYSTAERMSKAIINHPRLKKELLEFQLKVIYRIEALHGHEMNTSEDLVNEISELNKNIEYADNNNFEKINNIYSHLKQDPVEWTARWEEVIDEATKKTYKLLKHQPRGMGFCFSYWHTLQSILQKDYQITWSTPSTMNPRVMFD